MGEAVMTSLYDISEQDENLGRVLGAIGGAVLDFLRMRGVGGRFHAQELREYVQARSPIAPASPDRVLRQLRLQGHVGYRCVDRAASWYEITAIR